MSTRTKEVAEEQLCTPTPTPSIEMEDIRSKLDRAQRIASKIGMTLDSVRNVFSYHAPTPGQVEQYQAIREAAENLALVIISHCPDCADRSAALRKVREAAMTANASIALDGTGI